MLENFERVLSELEDNNLSVNNCCLAVQSSVEIPLVEAVVDHVNISEGARAVLKCRIKSSSSDSDIVIRWFHNASPIKTSDHFAVQHSTYHNSIYALAVFCVVHTESKVVTSCELLFVDISAVRATI